MPALLLWSLYIVRAMHRQVFPRIPLFVCLLWAISAPLSAWGEPSIQYPSGPSRFPSGQDFADHPLDSRAYNEFWTYSFLFENGLRIQFNLSRANVGRLKDPVCGSDVSLIGFSGKNVTVAREYPEANFSTDASRYSVRVHKDIWVIGDLSKTHRVYFKTNKNDTDYLIDLRLDAIERGLSWGDGLYGVNGESVGIFIHIANCRVKGTVAVNADTLKVAGEGYMDHTFQSEMGAKLADRGIRFKALRGDSLHTAYLIMPKGASKSTPPLGYGLSGVPGALQIQRPREWKMLETARAWGVRVPTRLEVVMEDRTYLLERAGDSQRLSILHEFSGLTKWAVKKFMGGEIIYFRGTGRLDGKPAAYDLFSVK